MSFFEGIFCRFFGYVFVVFFLGRAIGVCHLLEIHFKGLFAGCFLFVLEFIILIFLIDNGLKIVLLYNKDKAATL